MSTQSGLEEFRFAVEGIGLVFVGMFGIIGNISTVLWFSRKLIQKNFHQLMLTLAISDLLYVILSIFLFSLPSIFRDINEARFYNTLVPFLLPLAQISLTGSIYLTLAIAVERYTTVCHPFFKISHAWTSWMYILPILMFAVIYNAPKFFELTVLTEMQNRTVEGNMSVATTPALAVPSLPVLQLLPSSSTSPAPSLPSLTGSLVGNQQIQGTDTANTSVQGFISSIAPTSLRLNSLYIKIYLIYSNLFIHGIIPLVLLVFLNIAIYRQIREYQAVNTLNTSLHHREVRLAQVSIGIVAVFILCHSVKWVPNIYELLQVEQSQDDQKDSVPWPVWVEYVTCLSHLLTTFNSSVNFYIYAFKHFKRDAERQSSASRQLSNDLKVPCLHWSQREQRISCTLTVLDPTVLENDTEHQQDQCTLGL